MYPRDWKEAELLQIIEEYKINFNFAWIYDKSNL